MSRAILEKLSNIQQELRVPKSLRNSFGGYMYRSAEGILEVFKKYEKKYQVTLILSDELIQVGERYYIKSTALLKDTETGESEQASAYARESETKKGMDESQITGTSASYARKYALNGLLLLDDSKDADSEEYLESQCDQPAREPQKKTIESICSRHRIDKEQLCRMNNMTWNTLTDIQAGLLLNSLKQKFGDE